MGSGLKGWWCLLGLDPLDFDVVFFVVLLIFFMQWLDREAKTPLIVACMNPELHNVAKTLIELGANVNAYRPGICLLLVCYGLWFQ